MATYKVCNSDELDANIGYVADAIRTMSGTNMPLSFPSGMISAVSGIMPFSQWSYFISTYTEKQYIGSIIDTFCPNIGDSVFMVSTSPFNLVNYGLFCLFGYRTTNNLVGVFKRYSSSGVLEYSTGERDMISLYPVYGQKYFVATGHLQGGDI